MSWQATSWAKGVKTSSPSRKAVLMILAEHCDQWGYAWAGIPLIAEESELGKRQVQRILQELVEGGLLGICEPVKPGRGRFNMYRFAHGASAKAGAMPAEHPSLSETIGPCRWADPAAEADGEKGDKMSPIPGPEKGDIGEAERCHLEHEKVSPVSPEPIGTRFEPERAPNAAAVDNSGAGRANGETEPEDPPPACAVWRENERALQASPAWPLLKRAIPDADDGECLTLAVEAPWVGFAILAWASKGALGAEEITGRRIACRVRKWVQAALAERGQFTAGKPSHAAHRRDGEIVALTDTAWMAWQKARAEHPECEWLDCAMPDDIENGELIVGVGTARLYMQLLDGAVDQLTSAVGITVKPRYAGDVDAALLAQRQLDPLRNVAAKAAEGTG